MTFGLEFLLSIPKCNFFWCQKFFVFQRLHISIAIDAGENVGKGVCITKADARRKC